MSQSRPVEIRALAGARAIPPLILVLFHYCAGRTYPGAKWFDLPVGKGYLWVEFFFILSGFVLTYVYGARWRDMWQFKSYVRFIETRLTRLYPLHLFMLFVILFMVITMRALAAHYGYVSIYDEPYHPINTWPTFIANLFLVQAWNMFPYLSWNGASWFVSVEFLLCLSDAALFHDLARRRCSRRPSHRLRRCGIGLSVRLRRPCRPRPHFEIRTRPHLPQRHLPRHVGFRHRRGTCRFVRRRESARRLRRCPLTRIRWRNSRRSASFSGPSTTRAGRTGRKTSTSRSPWRC